MSETHTMPAASASTPADDLARSGYLDTVGAAKFLLLSPKTLERFRVEGCGPRYFKLGTGLRAKVIYKPADLVAWAEAISYNSTSEYRKGPRR